MKASILVAAALAATALAALPSALSAARAGVCAECVKANMQRLAGEEFHGRGCGTEDEHAAARFIAETLKRSGIDAGFGSDAYLQPVELLTLSPSACLQP